MTAGRGTPDLPGRPLTSLALVVAVLLAAFGIMRAAEAIVAPDAELLLTEVEALSQLSDGSWADLGQTAPLKGRYYRIDPRRSSEKKVVFDWPAQLTAAQPAIYITNLGRSPKLTVFEAGQPVWQSTRPVSLYKRVEPHLFALPPGEMDLSRTTLQLHVTSNTRRSSIGHIYVGDLSDLERAYRWKRALALHLPMGALGVAALAALVTLAAARFPDHRDLTVAFGATMCCWTIRNAAFVGPPAAWGDPWGLATYYISTFGLLVSSIALVNAWTFRIPWITKRVVPAVAVLCLGLIALAASGHLMVAHHAGNALGLFVFITLIAVLASSTGRAPMIRWPETATFMLCLAFGVIDVGGDAFPGLAAAVSGTGYPFAIAYGPLVPLLLAAAMISSALRYAQRASRILEDQNMALASALSDREQELARIYHEREASVRRAAHMTERERIMRDMHDGFGGRLLALALKAERGGLETQDMADDLRSSLQDLRLVVDSMDTAEDGFDVAIGALRGRIEPQIDAAGFSLVWDIESVGDDVILGAEATLSLYRIVQEAVANALHHSGGNEITVRVSTVSERRCHKPDSPRAAIIVEVVDNGAGLPPGTASKRGLRNMQNRAAAMGATLTIAAASPNGTRVRLSLGRPPVPAATAGPDVQPSSSHAPGARPSRRQAPTR